MEFLYLLESIRCSFLDSVMLFVTTFGEETALLVVALILFWCVDKKQGYYVLAVGFLGTLANQFMKLLFRVPRPWIRDPSFTIVEAARDGASGFSFPSGHTQTAVGLYGAVAVTAKHRWVKAVALLLAVLVGFSRMYLGVHTPADVLVGAVQSVLLLLIVYPFVYSKDGKMIPCLLGGIVSISVFYLMYVEGLRAECYTADEAVAYNITKGIENAYKLLGCSVGLLFVWLVDCRLKFCTESVWWAQLVKVGIGLILVLAVKEGLRAPLEFLCGGHEISRAVRYFLIVIVAGIVWPMCFRYFPKKVDS